MTESQGLSTFPVRHVAKPATTKRDVKRANASKRTIPWKSKPGRQIGPQKQDAQYVMIDCAQDEAQYL